MSTRRFARPLLALATLLSAVACGSDPVAPINATVALEGRLERGDSARVVITREGVTVPVSGATVVFTPATTAHLLASGWVRFDAAGPLEVAATLVNGGSAHAQVTITDGTTVALQGRVEVTDSARVVVTRNGAAVAPGSMTITATPAGTAQVLANGYVRFTATGPVDVAVTFPDGAGGHVAATVLAGPVVTLEGAAQRGDSARLVVVRNGAPVPLAGLTVAFTPSANAHLLASGFVKFDLAGAVDVAVTFPDGASRHVGANAAASPATVTLMGRFERGDSARIVVAREGAVVPPGGYTLAVTPPGSGHVSGEWVVFDQVGAVDVAATFPDGGTGHIAVSVVAAPTVALSGTLEQGDSARVVIVRNGAAVPVADVATSFVPAGGAHLIANGWARFDATGSLTLVVTFADGASARTTVTIGAAPVSVSLEGALVQGDSARLVITSAGAVIPADQATVTIAPAGAARLVAGGWVKFDAPGVLDVAVTLATGRTGHAFPTIRAPVVVVSLEGRLERGDSARVAVTREGVLLAPARYTLAVTPAASAHLAGGWVVFDATGAVDVAATLLDGGTGHAIATVAPAPTVALQGSLVKGDSARIVLTRNGAPIALDGVAVTFNPAASAHLVTSGWARFDATGPVEVVATFADGATARATVTISPAPLVVSLEGPLVQGDSVRVVITSEGAAVPAGQATLTITPTGAAHLLASGWLMLDAAGPLDVAATVAGGGSGHVGVTVAVPVVTVALEGRLERGDSARVIVTRQGVVVPTSDATVTVTPAANAHLLAGGWLRLDEAGAIDVGATLATGGSAHTAATIATPPLIVFDFLEAGNRDIYVMALDGRDRRRLTTSTGDDQHPTAVGNTVVFTSYRDGNAELYTVPLSGGGDVRLTTTSANETEPSLSPNGARLAYISSATGAARLWTSAANGTGGVIAPTGAALGTVEAQPTWSPASDRIAFTSTNAGTADLYLFTPAVPSVAVVPGANTDKPEVESTFAPDGLSLVFVSARTAGSGLYRLRFGDPSATLLLAGSIGQPTTLADGRIVFTQFDGSTTRLRWIDPVAPTVLHDIAAGTGSAAHASAVRP